MSKSLKKTWLKILDSEGLPENRVTTVVAVWEYACPREADWRRPCIGRLHSTVRQSSR